MRPQLRSTTIRLMEEEDPLHRLEMAADQIASDFGGVVDSIQVPGGGWLATIEPVEDYGDWAIRGEGATKAQALSDLIKQARKQGAGS